MDILDIIKSKRKEMRIAQEEMANKLNMPRSTYYNIEANVVALKACDFLHIIKILDIPLSYFTNEDQVVITKKDFEELKKASKIISNITENTDSISSIVSNSKDISTDINTNLSKKRNCEICGAPSRYYPLCKKHALLKQKGLVYKDENGHWIEKK